MPVTGLPDLDKHRNCEKCDQWFEEYEGRFLEKPRAGYTGIIKDAIDGTRVRFRCQSCIDKQQRNRLIFWASLAGLVGLAYLVQYWLASR